MVEILSVSVLDYILKSFLKKHLTNSKYCDILIKSSASDKLMGA